MIDKEHFLDHLEALRQTILRALLAFAILLIPAALLVHQGLPVLLKHLSGWVPGYKFYYMTPLEPFFIELKLTLAVSFLLGLPVHFLLWSKFLAPALYQHEKRLLSGLLCAALALFAAGGSLALFGVLPMLLKFSAGFATTEWQPLLTFNSLLSLAVMLLLGFGLIFQLPIVILLLVRGGLLQTATLRKHRPAVLVGILILAAILTPPDVISQCMMAIPAYLFFEISLFIAGRLEKRKQDLNTADSSAVCTENETVPAEENISPSPGPQEFVKPDPQEEDLMPDVYTRHRRGIRQGRPRRYRGR